MIIPDIRPTAKGLGIDTKNLAEALKIWSSMREHASEMTTISDNWARIHRSLPPDVAPVQREVELKEFYHHAGMTIGNLSTEILEKILEEIADV